MLTSFFSKSTPINYLPVIALIIVGYILNVLQLDQTIASPMHLLRHIELVLLMIFVILLLDFIIRKNAVTGNNTYALFVFTVFLFMLPCVYQDTSILFSTIFLFLATRRILSLRTEKNTEKKIFDAAMYISIASLFFFWAFLFFIVLIVGIVQKTARNPRYFLIPLTAILAIGILFTTYQILVNDSLSWFSNWFAFQSFDFSSFNNLSLLVPTILLIGLLLWTGSVRFVQIPKLSKKQRPAAKSLVLMAVVLISIAAFGSHANGSELLFILMPTAISTANYVETKTTKERAVFNEILLWFILIIAIIIHVL